MRYMIHCCPQRMWYVNEYLAPSMVNQGIAKDDIIIWNDTEKIGNLKSFIESMRYIGNNFPRDEGIWHIQDDVIICRDFAERTKETYDNIGIISGFICGAWTGCNQNRLDEQSIMHTWVSFPCIYIPNKYCLAFANWINTRGKRLYPSKWENGSYDDFFFIEFIKKTQPEAICHNIKPNLVDHIDYLIGSSTLRKYKPGDEIKRSMYFEDTDLVDKLEEELKRR